MDYVEMSILEMMKSLQQPANNATPVNQDPQDPPNPPNTPDLSSNLNMNDIIQIEDMDWMCMYYG